MHLFARANNYAVAVWLALGVCIGAAQGYAETVKISFTHSLANAPFLIAKERGYFAAEGLSPEFIYSDSAGPITMAVVSGDADFGATGLSGGFLNLAGQGAMRIIAGYIYDFPGFHGAVRCSSSALRAMLKISGDRMPPCGVPVRVSRCSPSSVSTPALRKAFTSASTRLSLTRARTRSMTAGCETLSKAASMSASSAQR